MKNLHGILFSYVRSDELGELVLPRTNASVPFGGRFRMVDFMLSNMVNAGITDIGVVMHGKYQSLLDHLGTGKDWDLSRKHGGLKLLPLAANADADIDFHGRIGALYAVKDYLRKIRQDYVILADCDVVVNLSIQDVLQRHIATGADVTAVCTEAKKGSKDGVFFKVDKDGRIVDTACGQYSPEGYRALEIYIVKTDKLLELINDCISHNVTSWSKGVLQDMVKDLHLQAYVWDGYAAQVRSVQEYYDRSMELLDSGIRRSLFRADRPIRAKESNNFSSYVDENCRCAGSLIADGCVIEGDVENSILFPGVKVGKGAKVKNCILFKNVVVGEGATLQYAIVDKRTKLLSGCTMMGNEKYPLVIGKDQEI